MSKVIIMDHPLIQHKVGYIRRIETGTKDFRETISEIAALICYEATRELQDYGKAVKREKNGHRSYFESRSRYGGRYADINPCRQSGSYRLVS